MMRKKRGVSPIIAAILLIGLAVLAGAAIFAVVLPMLQSGTTTSDITVNWSGSGNATNTGTKVTFTVTVANAGTAAITGKVSATGVVAGGVTSTAVVLKVGSADVSTNGFDVGSGKTVTLTIEADVPSATSGDIVVNFDFGSVGLLPVTFSDKVT